MQLTPVIATHMSLALTAVTIGPVALWSRLGTTRPRLHRGMGYAWVTCMAGAAFSSILIRDYGLPNWAGYTPIHLLVPVTFFSLYKGLRAIADPDGAVVMELQPRRLQELRISIGQATAELSQKSGRSPTIGELAAHLGTRHSSIACSREDIAAGFARTVWHAETPLVRAAPTPQVDFEYVIHNADGGEVEHCGNGARCFVRFVREQGLTDKSSVKVKVHGGVIELDRKSVV